MNLDDPWDDSPPDTREVEVVRQKVKAEDEVEKYLVDEVRHAWESPTEPTWAFCFLDIVRPPM